MRKEHPAELTFHERVVDAPVDAQAVLLLLHAALALAAVELAGEQGADGAAALALGVGAQLVGAVACDALAQRAELGAAHGVRGARLARLQAVLAGASALRHAFCKGTQLSAQGCRGNGLCLLPGCSIPGSAQGQTGQGSEHLGQWNMSLLMAEGWNQMNFEVSSSPNHSMVL